MIKKTGYESFEILTPYINGYRIENGLYAIQERIDFLRIVRILNYNNGIVLIDYRDDDGNYVQRTLTDYEFCSLWPECAP